MIRPVIARVFLAAAVILAAVSCTRIPPERTLPPSVRSVAVPIFINRSAEPGIEEYATIYTQEEFLADGRLDLVRPRDADALINVTITDFGELNSGFNVDRVARGTIIEVRARVAISRNVPGQPEFGGERVVEARGFYNNDPRSMDFEPKPVGQERALRALAREIVREVLSGRLPEAN